MPGLLGKRRWQRVQADQCRYEERRTASVAHGTRLCVVTSHADVMTLATDGCGSAKPRYLTGFSWAPTWQFAHERRIK